MTERDDLDDLSVLARRGGLSDAERRRLGEGVASSVETSVLQQAGIAFEREAPVVPGDDARIEAIVRRLQGRRATPRRSRPLRRVLFAMAAGALIGGIAVAAVQIFRLEKGTAKLENASSALGAADARGHGVAHLDATSSAAVLDAPAATPVTSNTAPESSRPATTSTGVPRQSRATDPAADAAPTSAVAHFDDVTSGPDVTASALFADANHSRMRGDTARAVALYERLESTFPKSAEAMTAHLSLGLLLLQEGRAAQALPNFEACRAGSSVARPEALWGEAQALRRLGRSAEERAVLLELRSEYPSSAYGDAARERLDATR